MGKRKEKIIERKRLFKRKNVDIYRFAKSRYEGTAIIVQLLRFEEAPDVFAEDDRQVNVWIIGTLFEVHPPIFGQNLQRREAMCDVR